MNTIGPVLASGCGMKQLLVNSALVACSILAGVGLRAQSTFPTVSGETTNGTVVTLPQQPGAHHSIVAIAYGKKAQALLEQWYAPAYSRFVAKQGLFAGTYEVDLYLMPLFVGANKAAYHGSMKKLHDEVDPEVAERVIFVKDGANELIDSLKLKDKDIPYFFVIGTNGKILERVQGAFTVDKLERLEEPMLQ